jgi:hypothetical protein
MGSCHFTEMKFGDDDGLVWIEVPQWRVGRMLHQRHDVAMLESTSDEVPRDNVLDVDLVSSRNHRRP